MESPPRKNHPKFEPTEIRQSNPLPPRPKPSQQNLNAVRSNAHLAEESIFNLAGKQSQDPLAAMMPSNQNSQQPKYGVRRNTGDSEKNLAARKNNRA